MYTWLRQDFLAQSEVWLGAIGGYYAGLGAAGAFSPPDRAASYSFLNLAACRPTPKLVTRLRLACTGVAALFCAHRLF